MDYNTLKEVIVEMEELGNGVSKVCDINISVVNIKKKKRNGEDGYQYDAIIHYTLDGRHDRYDECWVSERNVELRKESMELTV